MPKGKLVTNSKLRPNKHSKTGFSAYGTVYTATKADGSTTEKFATKEVGLRGTGQKALEHIAKARTEACTMLRFRHRYPLTLHA